MDYNYHTHTFRCHHGTGTEEEYVLIAIENGIKYLGFSEHIHFQYEDGYQRRYRLEAEDMQVYVSEVNRLKYKYRDYIDIKLGFEMEYYADYFDKMKGTAIDFGAEYLILGQHFYIPDHPDFNPVYVLTDPENTQLHLERYVDSVVEAVKTGVFSYVCHPDILKTSCSKDKYQQEMKRICDICIKTNTPVEINLLGIRGNRIYPNVDFWEVAGKTGVPVTIGSDAHNPIDVYDSASLEKAKQIIKDHNLNYIGKPTLRPIKQEKS